MTSPIFASFTAFCETEGITPEAFRAVMSGAARKEGSPFAKVETGEITEEEFRESVRSDVAATGGDIQTYEHAMPFWQSYAGLKRYSEQRRGP